MEQCVQDHVTSESNQEDICRWKAASAGAVTEAENTSCGFDCNICLDLVQDPVVTFCGHVFCWPCIYRWLQSQRTSSGDPDHLHQCPVCKAQVSENTLIPLYGRGQSGKLSGSKDTEPGLFVPQRPRGPGCGVQTLVGATSTSSNSRPGQQLHYHSESPHVHQQPYPYYNYSLSNYSRTPAFGFAGTTTFHPMISMFGEMICARIFGNSSQTTSYTYPNTYSVATTSSARARRHVMQAERSLSRVSFFLCCCIFLCLLLF